MELSSLYLIDYAMGNAIDYTFIQAAPCVHKFTIIYLLAVLVIALNGHAGLCYTTC